MISTNGQGGVATLGGVHPRTLRTRLKDICGVEDSSMHQLEYWWETIKRGFFLTLSLISVQGNTVQSECNMFLKWKFERHNFLQMWPHNVRLTWHCLNTVTRQGGLSQIRWRGWSQYYSSSFHYVIIHSILISWGLVFAQFWSKSDNFSFNWWTTVQILEEKYLHQIFAKNVVSIGKKPVAGVG